MRIRVEQDEWYVWYAEYADAPGHSRDVEATEEEASRWRKAVTDLLQAHEEIKARLAQEGNEAVA